ncbi:peptidylprolyl isomerase [Viridibacterium curvum]|uniref:peptidylprolyl isomerase n=1 Tax=Viridibacterium curvum TaxID=1101404 RepID=A0ABP9QA40_9RHOO
MNFKLSILAVSLISLGALQSAHAQAAKKPAAGAKPAANAVATVNGTPLSKAMAQSLLMQIATQNPDVERTPPEVLNQEIREELIKRELLAQQARKAGVDKKDEFNGRLELARQTLLMGAYLESYVAAHPISEEAIKTEYNRLIQMRGDKEYKLRHIQTETEADAQALIKRLDGGARFDDVVKESKDIGSRDNGGDLGWMNPNPAFAAAVAQLRKGNYTKTPVKTEWGYHVILLEDERKPEAPDFDSVKDRVRDNLIQQMIQRHVDELRKSAKVE